MISCGKVFSQGSGAALAVVMLLCWSVHRCGLKYPNNTQIYCMTFVQTFIVQTFVIPRG